MFDTTLAVTAVEVFTYIGYIIVALIALMIMIIVHELGHYTAGKLLGFKIDEFAIGFGPAWFKKTNRKTGEVFSIRPFPIGGFCAFHGEDKDANDKTAFNAQPAWKRLIVLFAGAFMNFVSAILIITIYFSAYGQILPVVADVHSTSSSNSTFISGDAILSIDGKQVNIMVQEDINTAFEKVGDSAEFTVLRDGKKVKFTASKSFYLPYDSGDYVKQINGTKLELPIKFEDALNHSLTEDTDELTLLVVRYDNQDKPDEITEQSTVKVEKGKNSADPTGWYSYGFGITRSIVSIKLPFGLALGRSFSFCFFIVFKILASIGALLTGKIGLASAGGTITVIGTIAEVSALGFGQFLYVVAVLSANLAIMNLLPFPALDGSRMVFTLIEMIFRRPVPRKIEAAIHAVGLILLVVFAVFLDVFHLVNK